MTLFLLPTALARGGRAAAASRQIAAADGGNAVRDGAIASACYSERCIGDSHDLSQLCATPGECSGAGCVEVPFAGGRKVCGGDRLPSWCR